MHIRFYSSSITALFSSSKAGDQSNPCSDVRVLSVSRLSKI